MENQIRYSITGDCLTLIYLGSVKVIFGGDEEFDIIKEKALSGDLQFLKNQFMAKEVFVEKMKEFVPEIKVSVEEDVVILDSGQMPVALENKVNEFMEAGLPAEPFINFYNKLKANPHEKTRNNLYTMLEKYHFPIAEDGDILAYKRVDKDFKDIYTGTIDNSPGQTPKFLSWDEVDLDPTVECSNGLHIASWDYAKYSYGSKTNKETDRFIQVKVDPQHIGAVPSDYQFQKMRVLQYHVLKEISESDGRTLVNSDGTNYTPPIPTDQESECSGCGAPEEECYCGEEDSSDEICIDEEYEDIDDDEYCELCGDATCSGQCEDTCPDCERPDDDCTCNECGDCGNELDECTCDDEDEDEDW